MDNLRMIRLCSTIELASVLEKSIKEKNQHFINLIAYELTCRIYIPGSGQDFDEILFSLGYQLPKKEKTKIL